MESGNPLAVTEAALAIVFMTLVCVVLKIDIERVSLSESLHLVAFDMPAEEVRQ